MILKFSIILLLIRNIACNMHFDKLHAFNNALKHTDHFFEKLKMDNDLKNLSEDSRTKIDMRIKEHVRNVSRAIIGRHKRELLEESSKGVDVLHGFKDYGEFNFHGVRDINFFSLQYGVETIWFTVVLDATKVDLYQMNNGQFYNVGTYPLINGKQIILNCCTFGALLIIQNENGSILILRFSRVLDKYYLQPIQDFELNDMTHLTIWDGMNQLHLGIASRTNVSIFTWFGNYFDLTQVINIGTEKVVPFQSKGFMYLAVTGSTTLIFKYFLKFNKFIVIQRLPHSLVVSSFHLRDGHYVEHFISLSMGSNTVVYKEIHNRFVPFQQIPSGKSMVPVISKKAIVLLALHEETVVTYQYDGWRFVKLNTKLPDVKKVYRVVLHGKELLLMKYRNDTWAAKEPIWVKKKSYRDVLEEIRVWNINAKNTVQRTLKDIPDKEKPVRILKGHIDNFYVHKINEHDSQRLKNASKRYRELISKFEEQKMILQNRMGPKNLNVTSLDAKKVSIKCKTRCTANRLVLKGNTDLLSKLNILTDKNQMSNFKQLTTKQIRNWKCPRFSLPIENIIIDNSINGIYLDYLKENALKVTGDQVVTGEHSFVDLNATNASMPLDIATYITSQELRMREIKVRELNLTEGGILLPLNGTTTTVTGSIEASKLKVQGVIHLRGKISGDWMERLSPMIFVSKPMYLTGDYVLENAKIEHLQSGDLIAVKSGSVREILSNAVPFKDTIVPVSLILSSLHTKWSNVTLRGPQRWITSKSENIINVTGRKHFLHNVEIPKSSYDKLTFPRLEKKFCATSIIAPEIKTSTLTAGNITVTNLTGFRIFGNLGERYSDTDNDNTTSLFKSVLPGVQYYQNVTAGRVLTTKLNNINLTELETLVNSWIDGNALNASLTASNLIVKSLVSPVQFDIALPRIIGNIIFERDVRVDGINNINVPDFLTNAIRVGDMISLQNITFNKGFNANRTYAINLPSTLMEVENDLDLRKKVISGSVKVSNVNLPYHSFEILESEAPVNIFVKGSVNFVNEPTIKNVNDIRLQELLTELWLATTSTVFYGKDLHIKDVVMKGKVKLTNSMGTLNPETWENISKQVLSKTKTQEIKVPATLNDVNSPIIQGSNTSTIWSVVPEFNNIFHATLMKHKSQRVRAKWTLDTLKILGTLNATGRINNMNLAKDIIRHDVKENIVTGKKIVAVLTAENLNGYNFDKWADNALTQKHKNIIVKGLKHFDTVTFNNIRVSGTVAGFVMEDVLTKSTNQTIGGQKKIVGSVGIQELVINGLVNDVNLTSLMERQLKKHKAVQTISSEIELQSNLNIVGNLTINGSYAITNMQNFNKSYPAVTPVEEKLEKSYAVAEAINTALRNRASYINKFEILKNAGDVPERAVRVEMERCMALNLSRRCIDERAMNIAVGERNASDFLILKTVTLDEGEFIVFVSHDSISIYLYDNVNNKLVRSKELYVPRITDAYVEAMSHSLWIVLRLTSQTLAIRYRPWSDAEVYALPGTRVFTINRAPDGHLLLLLSDGVWILDGLASPRNIIGVPLKETIDTYVDGMDYYVKYTTTNNTKSVMKARYVGN